MLPGSNPSMKNEEFSYEYFLYDYIAVDHKYAKIIEILPWNVTAVDFDVSP